MWLEYQEGSWKFIERSLPPSSAKAEDDEDGRSSSFPALAACPSPFLRPDRLLSRCFSLAPAELGLAASQPPLFVEVGGPEGPASHVRGEYQRLQLDAGRAEYVKPDGSMRLCLGLC